jgi:hypothetical protein
MSKYFPSSRWVDHPVKLERHFTPIVVQRIIKKTLGHKGVRSTRIVYAEAPKLFSLPWDMDGERTQGAETPTGFLGRSLKVGAQEYIWRWRSAVLSGSEARSAHRRQLAALSKKCTDICDLLAKPSVVTASLEQVAIGLKIDLRKKGTWLERPSSTADRYKKLGANFEIGAATSSVEMLKLLADESRRLFDRKSPKGGDESLEWFFRFLKSIFEEVFQRKFAASNQDDNRKVGGPAVRFCAAVLSELGITMTGNAI